MEEEEEEGREGGSGTKDKRNWVLPSVFILTRHVHVHASPYVFFYSFEHLLFRGWHSSGYGFQRVLGQGGHAGGYQLGCYQSMGASKLCNDK